MLASEEGREMRKGGVSARGLTGGGKGEEIGGGRGAGGGLGHSECAANRFHR